MEEKLIFVIAKRFCVFLFVFALASAASLRAQTTNIITLCTEEALRTYIGLGGVYQVGDCGTNVNILTIPITKPLVVEKDFTLIATQDVLLDAKSLNRLFVVKPGAHLTLQRILLFSGRQTETNFNDGGIPDTAGAGIYNDGGSVTIRDGRFEGNNVVGVVGFAGTDGTGENGEAGGDAAGGAIYNKGGQIWISNTVFVANTVAGGTGGKGGGGRNGFGGIGGNGGLGGTGAGGAIYSRGGSLAVYASTFTTNTATGSIAGAGGAANGLLGFPGEPGDAGDAVGAAVSGDNTTLTIYGCTFNGNTARAANGLAGNAGPRNQEGDSGRAGGEAAGGAIYSTGFLRVTNSTFFANSVVGGAGGAGGAGGTSGFGGNGGRGGTGGGVTGAAIESSGGGVVVGCTFSDNGLTPGAGGVGGVAGSFGDAGSTGEAGFAAGGAIYARDTEVSVANNILAGSANTVDGKITDRGGNLSTDLNSLLLNPASLRLTNPYLRPLATNGGPTMTMAIATNSPAIDAGIIEFCVPLDQRGSNRLGRCDIGAFELTTGDRQSLPQIPETALNSLAVSRGTNLVMLQWAAGYSNLFVQFTTNLLSTNITWSLAPLASATNDGANLLNVSTTNNARPRAFFRLYGITNLTGTNTLPNPGPPLP